MSVTEDNKIPEISEIGWGSRTAQTTPPGVISIILIVLTIFIGMGIRDRARQRYHVHRTAISYLECWKNGDFKKLKDMYGNPHVAGLRSPGRIFMPNAGLTHFPVPSRTRTRKDDIDLAVVFRPEDWKGHQEPWNLDLSRIQSYELEQVRVWRRYSQGAAAANVTIQSNQGPVKRRVVIFCLTESARCPITAVQILPPGMDSVAEF